MSVLFCLVVFPFSPIDGSSLYVRMREKVLVAVAGLERKSRSHQMDPPHSGDEIPRDSNGVPYKNVMYVGPVEKKTTYSQ